MKYSDMEGENENLDFSETILDEDCPDISSMLEVELNEVEGDVKLNWDNFESESSLYEKYIKISIRTERNNGKVRKVKDFMCLGCGYKGRTPYVTKLHVRAVHGKERPFKCDLCTFACARAYGLNIHSKTVHGSIKPFKCNVCNFRAVLPSFLKKHERNVHGDKTRTCTLCSFTTQKKDVYRSHREQHASDMKYIRHARSLKTVRSTSLKNRTSAVHRKNNKPYGCPQCEFKSSNKRSLQRHIKSKHSDKKVFQRSECNYRTPKKDRMENLKIHNSMNALCKTLT